MGSAIVSSRTAKLHPSSALAVTEHFHRSDRPWWVDVRTSLHDEWSSTHCPLGAWYNTVAFAADSPGVSGQSRTSLGITWLQWIALPMGNVNRGVNNRAHWETQGSPFSYSLNFGSCSHPLPTAL